MSCLCWTVEDDGHQAQHEKASQFKRYISGGTIVAVKACLCERGLRCGIDMDTDLVLSIAGKPLFPELKQSRKPALAAVATSLLGEGVL